jgi:hypothetical protein
MYEHSLDMIANISDNLGMVILKSENPNTRPAHLLIASDSNYKLEETIRNSPKLDFLFKSVPQTIKSARVSSVNSDGISVEYHFVSFHLDKGLIPTDLNIVEEYNLVQAKSHNSFLEESHLILQEYYSKF